MKIEQYHLDQINGRGRESGYRRGKSVEDVAHEWAADLLQQLEAGNVNDEYGYQEEPVRGRRIIIAGGGPGAELLLLRDHGRTEGYLHYFEGASAIVELPDWMTERLMKALNEPMEEPNDYND